MADAARFAELDDAARHGLRKRLNRLRYSLDFVAPLFAAKAVTRYLALLKPAQEALGDANDVALTEAPAWRPARTRPAMPSCSAGSPHGAMHCRRALRLGCRRSRQHRDSGRPEPLAIRPAA